MSRDVQVATTGVIELTQTLVRIPTVNPPGDEALATQVLMAAMHDAGLVAVVDVDPDTGRPNVLGHFDTGVPGPHLVFNSHIDVVPPGDGWTHDPYGADIADGLLYGRGSADTKGGVAATIVGVGAALKAGAVRRGSLTVAIVADEEERQTGTKWLRTNGTAADLVVVAEPTSLVPTIAHKGGALFAVCFTGVASHGSRPHLGVNAVEHAARFVSRVSDYATTLAATQHPLLGPPTLNISKIDGGFAAFAVPDRCVVTIDRRLLPGETARSAGSELEQILAEMVEEIPQLDATVTTLFDGPPLDTSPNHPLVAITRRSIEAVRGRDPGTRVSGGGTDAGLYSTYDKIPAVVLGPGDVSLAHAADEYVPVAELIDAALVFAQIARMALDDEPVQLKIGKTS
jgi:succinyl-diaminopimelate desuccinylase